MPEIHQTHQNFTWILFYVPASILFILSPAYLRGSIIHNPKCQSIVKQICMNENLVWCYQREEDMINETKIWVSLYSDNTIPLKDKLKVKLQILIINLIL